MPVEEPTAGNPLLSLEWLRDVSDKEARDYLMSIEGGSPSLER